MLLGGNQLTISKLASQCGLGVETIRFYERSGLIDSPPRGESGYRHYPPDAIARITFIRQAKELGFTLREINELLSLGVSPGSSCGDVRLAANAKIRDVEAKIEVLNSIRDALGKLVESCRGDGPVSDCPILEALESAR